jgi:aryl-phospho-beta-D-glucosidase BglC (GH1 family)
VAAAGGFLHTDDAHLLDGTGQEVHLTGINWFGLETCSFAPHGLWARNWRSMMAQIKSLGFNTIRVPFSSQLLDNPLPPNGIDYTLNPDLKGLTGLQIMDKIVDEARVLGLKIILDRHRPDCGAQSPLWYTDHYSEASWIADWVMLAKRYAGNDAVIGADLHNEPHGPATWGDGNPATDWRLAAERAGNAILRANPNWLIFVEGVEHLGSDWYWWGGNLADVGRYPVHLIVPGRLVYEVHDYGPEVSNQSWFNAADFPRNLPGLWDRHWGYLQERNVAPVLVGEFGGKEVDRGKEGAWIHSLMGYIRAHDLSFTFWCWNPNSGDTGGLLENDWKTINRAKMALLRHDLAPLIESRQERSHVPRSEQPRARPVTPTPHVINAHGMPATHHAGPRRRTPTHARARPGRASAAGLHAHRDQPLGVQPHVINGISTAEDDLILVSRAPLYHLRITLSVRRSSPGVDPGEANPQTLVQGSLSGHVAASTVLRRSALDYTVTGLRVPSGTAAVMARFDFTSPHQNRKGAHGYGEDNYRVQYATTPGGSLTTIIGSF